MNIDLKKSYKRNKLQHDMLKEIKMRTIRYVLKKAKTQAEACEVLGITKWCLYKMRERGELE